MDDKKTIDEMIEESLSIPDLKIIKSDLGRVYSPSHEESGEDGYVTYEELIYYPEFKREHVTPRSGVGHEDKNGEILEHVEFLWHDDEDCFGRKKPEFGYKFSEPKVIRMPYIVEI